MSQTLGGFRFGDSFDVVTRKCRTAHFKIEDVDRKLSDFTDVRCGGVPSPEPGIDGSYFYVGLCRGAVCQMSLYATGLHLASTYRAALAKLTQTYGKPTELTPFAAPDPEVLRACATDADAGELASAAWRWTTHESSYAEVSLSCGALPSVVVALTNAFGIQHYESLGDTEGGP
jgi:hypothetical protein